MLGHVLDERYEVLDVIGDGGMATVYRALDKRLNREVALKVLHQHLARNEEFRQRFSLEASIAAKLEHPNIVKIYDFGFDEKDERVFIVFELVRGKNLHQFTEDYKAKFNDCLPPALSSMIISEVLRALQCAHKQGCIHRDVKPDNILVTAEGEVKLTDFGIAKVHATNLTITGKFLGSPSYSSPEQVQGQSIDARSDIYAAGIIFYELLTGRLPFEGANIQDVMIKIAQAKYRPLREVNPLLPVEFDRVIDLAMRAQPMQRYPNADAFILDVQKILELFSVEDCRAGIELFFKNQNIFLAKHAYQKSAAARVPTVERIPEPPLVVNKAVGNGNVRATRQTNVSKISKIFENQQNSGSHNETNTAVVAKKRASSQHIGQRRQSASSYKKVKRQTSSSFWLTLLGLFSVSFIGIMWMIAQSRRGSDEVTSSNITTAPEVSAPAPEVQGQPIAPPHISRTPNSHTRTRVVPTPQASVRQYEQPPPRSRPAPVQRTRQAPVQRAPVTIPTQIPTVTARVVPTEVPTRPTLPEVGKVSLTTIPGGAPVFVNGQYMGSSSQQGYISFDVKPGSQKIQIRSFEISGTRFEGSEKNVFVEAGQSRHLGTVRLLPYRTLTIQISGPGVVVKVNNDPYPLNGRALVLKLPEGRVSIEAWAQNGRNFRRQIDLRGDDFTLSTSLD